MKHKRVRSILIVCCLLTLGLCGLSACNTGPQGVAAVVNDQEILEQDITASIEALRSQHSGNEDPEQWSAYLDSVELTPQSLRESVIKEHISDVLLVEVAQNEGYTYDKEAVEASLNQAKDLAGSSEEEWAELLHDMGYHDEEAYRNKLIANDLRTQMLEEFQVQPTNEELKVFIALYPNAVPRYIYPGAFEEQSQRETTEEPATDEAKVEDEGKELRDESNDTPTPSSPEVSEDVASVLESGLSADDIELETVPDEVIEQFEVLWLELNKGNKFQEWLENLEKEASITIYAMPSGLPYDV